MYNLDFDNDFFTSQQLVLVASQSVKFIDDLAILEAKLCDDLKVPDTYKAGPN